MNDGDQDVNDINNELTMKKEELTSGGGGLLCGRRHTVCFRWIILFYPHVKPVRTSTVLVSRLRKLRLRGVLHLTQDHTARYWQSQESHQVLGLQTAYSHLDPSLLCYINDFTSH